MDDLSSGAEMLQCDNGNAPQSTKPGGRQQVQNMEHSARNRNILVVVAVTVVLLVALGLALGLTLGLNNRNETSQQTRTTDSTMTREGSGTTASLPTGSGSYHKAAVATDHGPCSDMGRDILLAGGSAVDAAITSTLCLGVASPQSSGLGGGLFMIIYLRNGTSESITSYEAAPAASDFDMFVNNTGDANYGARAVGVPGELAGLWFAHQKYGTLPWQRLLTPVINMAEQGFPLAWHTEHTLKILEKNFDIWPILRELYTKPDGSLMKEGDLIRAPAGLIQTLRTISEKGPSAFYGGEVGQKLVQDIQEQGGIMTLEDLTNYNVTSKATCVLSMKDGQHRVLSTPVTSSGNLLLFTVNILDECNLASTNVTSYEGKLKMYHYFIEASTFAIGLRLHIGDAGTAEVKKAVSALSSKDYARTICSKINDSYVTFPSGSDYDLYSDLPDIEGLVDRLRRATSRVNGEELVDANDGDTSHLSVYSEQGDAVSLTTSVGRYFGSRTFSNQTGFFLNSHMGNFYYNGRRGASWEANRLVPGAQTMSTMGPSVILRNDGTVKAIIGSSGGMRIISTNAWIVLRALWGSDSLADMIDEPRVYAYRSALSSKIYYEKNFPQDILDGLRGMGHNMVSTTSFAAAQGILKESNTTIYAHSDRRKHGYPAGY